MNNAILLAIFAFVSYMFGNVNWEIIISKAKHKDIRTMGSGNPGTLNMSRNLGLKFGLLTFFLDIICATIMFSKIDTTPTAVRRTLYFSITTK